MGILIVDDSAGERLLLSTILKGAGFAELWTAASAEAAFAQLGLDGAAANLDVDLILMDISMPDTDGITACRCIKEAPALQDVPVIMVTGSSESDDLQAAFAAGAMDYITKPPRRPELLARVRSALRLKAEMDGRKARERQLLDYLEQVGYVTSAAAAVEAAAFDPASLGGVAAREDALGQLARVFQRMAIEVAARERLLATQVRQLQIEIDQARVARQVAAITETDYFQYLRDQVRQLRAAEGPLSDQRTS
jgi:CheY-like chemotaxis protein